MLKQLPEIHHRKGQDEAGRTALIARSSVPYFQNCGWSFMYSGFAGQEQKKRPRKRPKKGCPDF
jgi:hypothetical protein